MHVLPVLALLILSISSAALADAPKPEPMPIPVASLQSYGAKIPPVWSGATAARSADDRLTRAIARRRGSPASRTKSFAGSD